MRVAVRCDAGPGTGVGHLVRCVALAEEFVVRGIEPLFLADLGTVPWAERQVRGRGFALAGAPGSPAALVDAVRAGRCDLAVLDSYALPREYGAALRAAGIPVVALVDGGPRGQVADLYVDQNLDADRLPVPLPAGARRLAGLPYALLRESVRRLRPPAPPAHDGAGCPRVVCFAGGTDAFGAAPPLARLLVATGEPFALTAVAGRPETALALRRIVPAGGQSIAVIDPTDDLPALVAGADLVVAAAGSALWELLCLGAAAAVLRVADNQVGYDRVVARGLAAGLGTLADLAAGGAAEAFAVRALGELLAMPGRRAGLSARAWAAVDGRGRERVAAAATRLMKVNVRPCR